MKKRLSATLIIMLFGIINSLYSTNVNNIRPLVILMDYQDYSYGELTTKETKPHVTGDHYESYEKELYETMIFGNNTYTGPDGNNYITMKDFYYKVSKGSFNINGDVYGWFTAQNNAAYYGSDQDGDNDEQDEACKLVKEAVDNVAALQDIDLAVYDKMDPEDIDGDGNKYEPDGQIDILIIIHAGRGEEWGGGSLGEDAIWPFRSAISSYEGDKYLVTYDTDKSIYAENFLIVEQDFPMGLLCHEFGHFLGLPDLYHSSGNAPVSNWGLMSSHYSGSLPGSLPTPFGAFCRDELKKINGGDWANEKIIQFNELDDQGIDITLNAVTGQDDDNYDLVRINLPEKVTRITAPPEGTMCYYSDRGDNLKNEMSIQLDFSSYSSIELQFKTWYDIDPEYDYASVQVKAQGEDLWIPVEGNITTTENPHDDTPDDPTDRNPGHGITKDSNNQWIDAIFNLSAFAGKKIDLKFYWWTDSNTPEFGIYIDKIKIKADGNIIFEDNAEAAGTDFTLNGFVKSDGNLTAEHYYLMEWRSHEGLDIALTHTYWYHPQSIFNKGLLIWYIDKTYSGEDGRLDQDTNTHPGHAGVGICVLVQSSVFSRICFINIPDEKPFVKN